MFALCSNISSPKSPGDLAIKLIKCHGAFNPTAMFPLREVPPRLEDPSFFCDLSWMNSFSEVNGAAIQFACLTFVPFPRDEASREQCDIIIV